MYIKWYTEVDVDAPLDSALTTGSVASRGQLPDRFDDNISQNPENVSDPELNGCERTGADKSDGKAMFSLSNAGRNPTSPMPLAESKNNGIWLQMSVGV